MSIIKHVSVTSNFVLQFSEEILPVYFENNKVAPKFISFARRLTRWKFVRVPTGPFLGAYHNEFFVRDKPELVEKIVYSGASHKSKSMSKMKSAIEESRRASISRSLLQAASDPFNDALGSITAVEEVSKDRDLLNISPMPYSIRTLNQSQHEMTHWLSDASFDNTDDGSISPKFGSMSDISDLSMFSPTQSKPLPMSIAEEPKQLILPMQQVDGTLDSVEALTSISRLPYTRQVTNDHALPLEEKSTHGSTESESLMQQTVQHSTDEGSLQVEPTVDWYKQKVTEQRIQTEHLEDLVLDLSSYLGEEQQHQVGNMKFR